MTAWLRTLTGMVALLMCAAGAVAQEPTVITGLITTKADDLPVPGAVVTLVGTSVTATTDDAGRFRLEVPSDLARRSRVQIQIDALGLPPRLVDVDLNPGS